MLSRIALSLLPVFLALASGQSCDLFSLDECANPPNCPYEEVTKTDDPTTCSQFCNINPNCKSWAHLDREGLCRLIQCPITEWSEYCTLIGGPVEPSMAECQILDEGCDAHRRSFCAPKDPVGILNNINTPEVCQRFCQIANEGGNPCDYFTYDADQTCKLFDTKGVDCDVIIGPSEPVLGDCSDINITSIIS